MYILNMYKFLHFVQVKNHMSVSIVTRHLTTQALCDPMFCLIQRTDPTSVIMLHVARHLTTLDH